MHNNLVLIGFMGSGKSSVGRRLAAKQGRSFLDTDAEIVTEAGMSIRKIFSLEGESAFRDRETNILRRLVDYEGIVLATGGGIVLQEENRHLLRRIGPVIWLYAKTDILFERAMRSQKRPLLLVENPRIKFESLLAEREALYRKSADFQVDSSYLNHEETAAKILELTSSTGTADSVGNK
ncbi:MAG: shikimate kinase [Verrucomicrobia bacterium]|nr:MAG: shikimate kinase [Verrucomicrobiota bacterium]